LKKWFLKKSDVEKVDILRSLKEGGDLANYLTLIHWLIDHSPKEKGMCLKAIPDDAYWEVS
jgi:hypothetical protein